ncbi:acylphosphatase [Candidatus Micrarchaeota archaeon]|nr:acylphosphatase [Candidatus Micrarchaeota archaeon]
MAKAVFYIKDHVHDVGYRVYIVGKILESPLEGTAVNTQDGRVKVMLRGEKEHILQFYEELKKEKPELVENPTTSKLEFSELLEVPDAMRSSQHLMLGQFSKGVGFLAKMNQNLTGVNQNLAGVNQNLTGMDKKLDLVVNRLDELPKKIAEAIKS